MIPIIMKGITSISSPRNTDLYCSLVGLPVMAAPFFLQPRHHRSFSDVSGKSETAHDFLFYQTGVVRSIVGALFDILHRHRHTRIIDKSRF